MLRKVITIKHTDHHETLILYVRDERDFQRQIEHICAQPGIVGFSVQSTVSLHAWR